jgi:hypothetical protein
LFLWHQFQAYTAAGQHCRPRTQGRKPAADIREFREVLQMQLVKPDPTPAGDVGDAGTPAVTASRNPSALRAS